MTDARELRPSASSADGRLKLIPLNGDDVRTLTLAVGRDFSWPSQQWDHQQWRSYLDDRTLRHWAGVIGGEAIGLLSLNLQDAPEIEIDSFGLLAEHIGQGLGGLFLTEALRMTWALPARRIWLHTSSDDHPHALANYLARGFRSFDGP
ncbi:GNAT family N-acetyltransferase [Amycolatopsis sp. NPDC003676]